jgi:hypothetical protein
MVSYTKISIESVFAQTQYPRSLKHESSTFKYVYLKWKNFPSAAIISYFFAQKETFWCKGIQII